MIAGWKWRLAIALTVVFLAGAAIGLFVGARHARLVFITHHGSGHGAERMRERLQHQLSLTPQQSDQIAPIVDGMSARLEAIRAETNRRVATTFEQAHQQMIPLLTPEQRERLEKLKRRHQHMMSEHQGAPPPEQPNE